MGLFSGDKPYTAITSTIEKLCSRGNTDEDAGDILELIETIQIAGIPGHHEAGRALRKQLKHGGAKQQIRALWILEMCMDNGGKSMPELLSDQSLGDAVVLTARNGEKRPKRAAQAVLSGWRGREPRLNSWADQFFGRPGGASGSRSRSASTAGGHARYGSRTFAGEDRDDDRYDDRYDGDRYDTRDSEFDRPDRPQRPGFQDDDDDPRYDYERGGRRSRAASSARAARPPSRSPSPINIRGGSITTTMATAHTIATRLSESIITHPNIAQSSEAKGYYRQAKDMRKRVVNLVHKDDAEVHEYLDRLLTVNEELVTALQSYEDAIDRPPQREPTSPRSPAPRRSPPSRSPSPIRSPRPQASPRPRIPASPRRSPSPPSRSPSPRRPSYNDDDPFADVNESEDAPLHKPMW